MKAERLRSGVPHGQWKTATFFSGLSLSGIAAPFVLDEPIDRNAFETCIAKVLAPAGTGRRGGHGQPLPPCSPDFHSNEIAFAKLKALLRKAAERSVPALWGWDAIGRLIHVFRPAEAAKCFA
jgi:hypothetical protein